MTQAATLSRLQETDLEIMRAQKQLNEMPEKRAILETRKKIAEVEQLRLKAEQLVRKLKQVSSRHEDDISQVTEKFESEQKRVMSGEITNAKEIQHITREMDALRRRREKLEIDQLEIMERIEKAEGQVTKVDSAITQLKKTEAAHTAAFTERGGSLQTSLDELSATRADLGKSLDAELLARYESVREARGGVGCGVLVDAACTACRMELPAQEVAKLKVGEDIATCPVCRRVLIVRTGEEETPADEEEAE